MQIAKGLHRIGSDIVNSYLVIDGGSGASIDAGLPYGQPASPYCSGAAEAGVR